MTASSVIEKPSATVVSTSEFCRLARQFPSGPKRCLIALGGWSDWARIGSTKNAQKLAQLAAKLVLHTFADGIDLDFEHLSEYERSYGAGEIQAYTELANGIRTNLDAITPAEWNATVARRITALQAGPSNKYSKANVAYLEGGEHFPLSHTLHSHASTGSLILRLVPPTHRSLPRSIHALDIAVQRWQQMALHASSWSTLRASMRFATLTVPLTGRRTTAM